MIRTLLVDDERLARKRLSHLLAAHPDIEIVGEADCAEAACAQAARFRPDLVFLDIQMPREDGLSVLSRLPLGTAVVFVTAHDQYAVRAFELAALDYLLKPVAPARLALTMERIRSLFADEGREVLLGDTRNWAKVNVVLIHAIQAQASYTRTLTGQDEAHMVRRSMQEWEDLLPSPPFLRLSRSLIVNRNSLVGLKTKNRDEADLFLKDTRSPIVLGRVALTTLRRECATDFF